MNAASEAVASDAGERDRVDGLKRIAVSLRKRVVRVAAHAGGAHIGGSLSSADILAVLMFDVMRLDPARPELEHRDYLVYSKGHSSAILYAALAERGFLSDEEVQRQKRMGSRLAGHPLKGVPGVELATGSLGHGLSVGVGIAMAIKRDGGSQRVFVLLGDGECQEGSVWEAAMAASHYRLDNLVAVVDRNGIQEDGPTEEIMALEPLAPKWQSFGWSAREIDGHDIRLIRRTFRDAPFAPDRPSLVLAHTIKGKGVSFFENTHKWHYGTPTAEQVKAALAELDPET